MKPKPRKKIKYDYTYEKGPRCIFDRAKKVTPKGWTCEIPYWVFTKQQARAVGVYTKRGHKRRLIWLDTKEERTIKPRKISYNGFAPTTEPKPLPKLPKFVPAPIPDKIIPMKVGIRRMLKEKDIVILYWAAKGETEWAKWAQKEAKRLGVKLPKIKAKKKAGVK